MAEPSADQATLWAVIVTYGLEEQYERDWLGRIKSRRTKRYIRADITPELAQIIADARAQLGGVAGSARAALGATPEGVRRLISGLRETEQSD